MKISIEEQINQQGFWIPTSALTDGIRGQWNIFKVAKSLEKMTYKISKHTVNVLYTNDKSAFISGLSNGEQQIIASGLQRLVNGQMVRDANAHESKVK